MVRNAYFDRRMMMAAQTQQQYLNKAKSALVEMTGEEVTWDEFAELCGIKPRAFKTYRMPEDSKDYRAMSDLARQAVDRLLTDKRKRVGKRNAK